MARVEAHWAQVYIQVHFGKKLRDLCSSLLEASDSTDQGQTWELLSLFQWILLTDLE